MRHTEKVEEIQQIIEENELSVEEASRLGQVSFSTVYKWLKYEHKPNTNILDSFLEKLKEAVRRKK